VGVRRGDDGPEPPAGAAEDPSTEPTEGAGV
jgi:hypothetical protein